MLHLGAFLKQAREEKGLSLDDMQELTKIKVAYLHSIERGQYDDLPGLFYVRAFVKTYCEALGLPANEVMDIYASDLPSNQIANSDPEESELQIKPKIYGAKKWKSSVVIWSIAILLLLVVYYMVTSDDETPKEVNETTKQPTVNKQVEKPVEKPVEKSVNSQTEQTKQPDSQKETQTNNNSSENVREVSKGKKEFLYEVYNSDKVRLEMTASAECYVHYKDVNSEKINETKILKAGESIVWENDKDTLLKIGAMEKLRLTVNGTPINFTDYVGVRSLVFEIK